MARPHVLRGNEGTEAASLWCFFDCESRTQPFPGRPNTVQHFLRLGRAKFVRLAGAQVIQTDWLTYRTPAEFWPWVTAHASAHRPLWLVAHNTGFDWPLVGGYDWLMANGLDDWRLIFGPPVTIMSGKVAGRKLVVIDSLNYFRASLDELGRWLGLRKLPLPADGAPEQTWLDYCTRDVEILSTAVLRLVELIRFEDLGVMGKTMAQCAMHSYRHRLGPRSRRRVSTESRAAARGQTTEPITAVTLHGDDEVTALERAAYFGGRVECRRIGQVQGPIYQLDANSLYAAVMKDTPLPCKLRGVYRDTPVEWLEEQLGLYEAIAAVDVHAKAATYPYRTRVTPTIAEQAGLVDVDWQEMRLRCGPLYPHGTYATSLCGVELRRALNRGDVVRVKACVLYERALLFTDFVDYWYGQRLAAFTSGDKWLERVAKSFLTCLAGVWAKRAARWVTATDWSPTEPWERITVWDAIADKVRIYRAIANVAQEEVVDGEPYDVLPVVSACITSAARERLRDWQRLAGLDHWLYEDTDALLLDQTGYDRLVAADQVHETRLGALRVQSVSELVHIRGVKDYTLDGRRVCRGVRADAEWLDDWTYRQPFWSGHHQSHASRDQIGPLTERRTVFLKGHYLKGRVSPNGWVSPFLLDHQFEKFDLF